MRYWKMQNVSIGDISHRIYVTDDAKTVGVWYVFLKPDNNITRKLTNEDHENLNNPKKFKEITEGDMMLELL